MDLQVQTVNSSTCDAQQPDYQSLDCSSSTSFQGPANYDVLTVSSLVPSTVVTLIPHYKPRTNGKLYSEIPSFSEVTSKPQLLETPSSSSGSSEVQHEKTLTSTLPCNDNPQEVQQRKPSDGRPLEEGSVGLILPKDLPDVEPESRACSSCDLLLIVSFSIIIMLVTATALLVTFLAFPSELGKTPPLCGVKGNCSVPTQVSFLSKNPLNQTGNITAGATCLKQQTGQQWWTQSILRTALWGNITEHCRFFTTPASTQTTMIMI
ncbi:uncharacterized protein LOC113136754 isoform X2 [Mastacembelus armatus]|uniref:uncharacterized protein LOC113136754 isoform X2 n=1 Tax=Mastacembelus armatus TaxID=205130 RepID=UPI001436B267|nr:uncharacterized protein LOC113136754 isoform X2 [Mastacembelus armatus]